MRWLSSTGNFVTLSVERVRVVLLCGMMLVYAPYVVLYAEKKW